MPTCNAAAWVGKPLVEPGPAFMANQKIASLDETHQTGARHTSRQNQMRAEKHYLEGVRAFQRHRMKVAEKEFLLAEKLDRSNPRYSLAARMALRFSATPFAREPGTAAHSGQILDALHYASLPHPYSAMATLHPHKKKTKAESSPVIVRQHSSRANAPIKLVALKADCSFHLHATKPSVIRQVLQAYGIQAEIGPDIDDQSVFFDVDSLDFKSAEKALRLATGVLIVPLGVRRALVVANTTKNLRQYDPQIMETITFPGMDRNELEEMENIARNSGGVTRAVLSPDQKVITLRAPGATLMALNHLYRELLDDTSEVRLDIHVYEVDRTGENDTGAILPNSVTLFNLNSEADSVLAENASLVQEIISSGLAKAGDWETIIGILLAAGDISGTDFNNPFVIFGGGITETGAEWNTTAANMLLTSSNVISLDQVQLSVRDQKEATFLDGERYPIMTGKLSNLGNLGESTGTSPQFQYVNLGLTLKVTPSIQANKNVTLHMKLQLSGLAGTTLDDIPVLTNRQYSGEVSIHAGYSALIVSSMSKQNNLDLTGMPGLSEIPDLHDMTNRDTSSSDQELVILVTPHIIRLGHPGISGPVIPLE
ncbi:type II secretion system protein GspD [Acidobacterium capsulatum]|nr:hypothetical protein [Acidobacterium capsulatum]